MDAHTDLSLRWAHRSFCWFCHVVARFISQAVVFMKSQGCLESHRQRMRVITQGIVVDTRGIVTGHMEEMTQVTLTYGTS